MRDDVEASDRHRDWGSTQPTTIEHVGGAGRHLGRNSCCPRLEHRITQANHTTFVVTKHGRPVARLVPLEEPPSTLGSVTLLAGDDDAYFSTGEHWDAG